MSYRTENITFKSGDNNLIGVLLTPTNSNGKTVTLIGPVGFVKEQAPLLYAQSLASKGYTALIYDPTYHGESEGTPRRFESGEQKTKDIIASLDYLEGLPHVNASEIYGVGICQGINWMINAANQDSRIKATVLVAGHYLAPEVAELYNGGAERLSTLLDKAKQAKNKFETTGEVEYIPVVGTAEQEALLTPPPIFDWYQPWGNNANQKGGRWENRITRMSLLEIWGGNTEKNLKELNTPTMVIHSDKAASGPKVPKRLFDVIPAKDKKLVWFEDQNQFQFYDDQPTIDRAVRHFDEWFRDK